MAHWAAWEAGLKEQMEQQVTHQVNSLREKAKEEVIGVKHQLNVVERGHATLAARVTELEGLTARVQELEALRNRV